MQIMIHADDFLHNMARMIVSTLLDIGLGTRKKDVIEDIFDGKQEPSAPCDPRRSLSSGGCLLISHSAKKET